MTPLREWIGAFGNAEGRIPWTVLLYQPLVGAHLARRRWRREARTRGLGLVTALRRAARDIAQHLAGGGQVSRPDAKARYVRIYP